MKKVLVCGATGFIGRNIVETLSKNKKYKITATYNKRPPFSAKGVKFVKADLTVPSDVDKVIKSHDIVIQAAANTTGIKDVIERPYVHVTDNAIMNSLILKSCYDHRVERLIFFSCTVMYQTKQQPFLANPVVESDFDPSNEIFPSYFGVGWTKVYVEKMCEFYSRLGRTQHYVIRHSNIYGPYDKYDLNNSHVFGAMINKVLNKNLEEVGVWGDGTEERDLLYVDDLVDSVEKVISSNGKEAFCLLNIGSGKSISIRNLVDKIIKLSGVSKRVVHDLSKPTVKTAVSLDYSLAEKHIAWSPKTSLDDGIKKTIAWYKKYYSEES